jgi:glucose/mannose-6-phosphate isomerase
MNKVDRQGMYKIYDVWPQIATQSYANDLDGIDFAEIDHIVFSGMGGSGAIGDVFSSILSKTDIHVDVVKGYLLPRTVSKESLVVCTSVSGNTVETLTVLAEAKKIGCKLVAFSSGGKMQQYCVKNMIPYRQVPFYHSPRASLASFLYGMLRVLDFVIPLKKSDVSESLQFLKKTQKKISSENLVPGNPSLSLAQWIDGIPLIYYPWGLQSAAIRFKASLQENAKLHAMGEDVIEACHNGIVSWERNSKVKPILIEGADDYVKTKERWKILKEYLAQNNIEYREIHSVCGNILSKIIVLIYQLDYTSIYKAIIDGVDPSPVRSIDFVKSRL